MRLSSMAIASLTTASLLTWAVQAQNQESLPGEGASPTTADDSTLDAGVDVSLGRQELKAQVARELGIGDAEVPLVVRLPMEVAERVCGMEDFEARANTNRSCTATEYSPEIADAVRDHPQTSAVPEQ